MEKLPDEFYCLLGRIVYFSNLYDNYLLHANNYKNKAESERKGLGQKIIEFEPIFNEKHKKTCAAQYPKYDFIAQLKMANKIRKMYVHGIPFMYGDKITSMKITQEIIDNNGDAKPEQLKGYTLPDLRKIVIGFQGLLDVMSYLLDSDLPRKSP